VSPNIRISQDMISLTTLNFINTFLGLGKVYSEGKGRTVYVLSINNLSDVNRFIEMFDNIQFYGSKALDYSDFCKIVKMVNKKEHLTEKGVKIIREIVSNMNLNRTKFK